jgi:hypothetical protein
MNDKQAVKARLAAIMYAWLLPIAPDCEQDLNRLIEDAARRIEREGLLSDPAKLAEAETNFRKVLTEMTRQAGALGLKELRERTLRNTLSELCPIWPFC